MLRSPGVGIGKVSGFEKRMLSGMFGLLSVDCAKVGEIVPATASVTAPGATRLRETWVENCCKSSEESVSAIVSIAVLAPEGRFALVHSGQFIQNAYQSSWMLAARITSAHFATSLRI